MKNAKLSKEKLLKRINQLEKENKLLKNDLKNKSDNISESVNQLRHTNDMMRTARNVIQLIISETNQSQLLKKTCRILIGTSGFINAWIVLFDSVGDYSDSAQAGVGKSFNELKRKLKSGEHNYCIHQALLDDQVVRIEDPSSICRECPLNKNYSDRIGLTVQLAHEGKVHGVLTLSVDKKYPLNTEHLDLLHETADDLASAIYAININDSRSRAEKLRKDNEEYLRTTLHSISDAVIATDKKGEVTAINAMAEKFTGWKATEAVGLPLGRIFNIVNSKTRKKVQNPVRKVLKSGKTAGLANHTILISKDGKEFQISNTGAPILNKDGDVEGVVIIFRDVTREYIIQQQITQSEKQYRSVVEDMPGLMCCFLPDTTISFVNRNYCDYFGKTEAELLGTSFIELIPESDREKVLTSIQSLSAENPISSHEHKVLAQNGQIRWQRWTNRAILDNSDCVISFQSIGEDITDYKEAEEKLHRSESSLKRAQAIAHIGDWEYDISKDEIIWSDEMYRIYGMKPQEIKLTAEKLQEFIHPDYVDYHIELAKKWDSEGSTEFEYQAVRPNGEVRWIRGQGETVFDSVGNPVKRIGIAQDITERKQAEQELKKQMDMFELVINSVPTRVFWKDLNSVYLGCNIPFAQDAGMEKPEKVIGRDDFVMSWKKDAEVYRADDTLIMQSGKPKLNYEEEFINKKGEKTVWLTNKKPLKDNEGRIIGIIAASENITERKIADQKLRESEEKFRALYENAPLPYQSLNEDGSFKDVNPAWLTTLGYKRGEVIGKNFADFLHPDWKNHFEKNFPAFKKRGYVQDVQFKILHKKGYYLDISFEGCIGYNPDGSFRQTYCVFQDITNRRLTELELSIRNQIANVFLTIPDDEMYNDVLSIVLKAMESEFGVFGYIGKDSELIVPTMSTLIWDKCDAAEKKFVFPRETWGKSSWPTAINEKRIVHSNMPSTIIPEGHIGITRHISLPIIYNDIVIGLLQVANKKTDYEAKDIKLLETIGNAIAPVLAARLQRDLQESERRQAEEELTNYRLHLEELIDERTSALQKANKELEAFAYSVSHDLRAPLRAIDGFTSILMDEHVKDMNSDAQNLAGIVLENVQKMAQLIDDLLTFSRLGRAKMYYSDVDMQSLVKTLGDEIFKDQDKKRFRISISEMPPVRCDQNMIRQVWVNLLLNAEKFSSKKDFAEINIEYYYENTEHVFSVSDNGAGFNMKYQNKLFGVFQRLHNEREFSGTGVGLALVKRIIERHGGRIWAKGEVDRGATFFFTLPSKPAVDFYNNAE